MAGKTSQAVSEQLDILKKELLDGLKSAENIINNFEIDARHIKVNLNPNAITREFEDAFNEAIEKVNKNFQRTGINFDNPDLTFSNKRIKVDKLFQPYIDSIRLLNGSQLEDAQGYLNGFIDLINRVENRLNNFDVNIFKNEIDNLGLNNSDLLKIDYDSILNKVTDGTLKVDEAIQTVTYRIKNIDFTAWLEFEDIFNEFVNTDVSKIFSFDFSKLNSSELERFIDNLYEMREISDVYEEKVATVLLDLLSTGNWKNASDLSVKQIDSLIKEMYKYESELNDLKYEQEEMKSSLEWLKSAQVQFSNFGDSFSEQLKKITEFIDVVTNRIDDLENKISDLQNTVNNKNNDLKILENSNASFSEEGKIGEHVGKQIATGQQEARKEIEKTDEEVKELTSDISKLNHMLSTSKSETNNVSLIPHTSGNPIATTKNYVKDDPTIIGRKESHTQRMKLVDIDDEMYEKTSEMIKISTNYNQIVSFGADALVRLTKAQHAWNIEINKGIPDAGIMKDLLDEIILAQNDLKKARSSAFQYQQERRRGSYINDPIENSDYYLTQFEEDVQRKSHKRMLSEQTRYDRKLLEIKQAQQMREDRIEEEHNRQLQIGYEKQANKQVEALKKENDAYDSSVIKLQNGLSSLLKNIESTDVETGNLIDKTKNLIGLADRLYNLSQNGKRNGSLLNSLFGRFDNLQTEFSGYKQGASIYSELQKTITALVSAQDKIALAETMSKIDKPSTKLKTSIREATISIAELSEKGVSQLEKLGEAIGKTDQRYIQMASNINRVTQGGYGYISGTGQIAIGDKANGLYDSIEDSIAKKMIEVERINSNSISNILSDLSSKLSASEKLFNKGKISIQEYIEELLKIRDSIPKAFSNIDEIKNLYTTLNSLSSKMQELRDKKIVKEAEMLKLEALGKDVSSVAREVEKLNDEIKKVSDSIKDIDNKRALLRKTTFGMSESLVISDIISKASDISLYIPSNDAKFEYDQAEKFAKEKENEQHIKENEQRIKAENEAIDQIIESYKRYLTQKRLVVDLENSGNLFDEKKVVSEKEKLSELESIYKNLIDDFNTTYTNRDSFSLFDANIEHIKLSFNSLDKKIADSFNKLDESAKKTSKGKALLDLHNRLAILFSSFDADGKIEDFDKAIDVLYEDLHKINGELTKDDKTKMSSIDGLINSMNKASFKSDKIQSFQANIDSLINSYNELKNNWVGSDEQRNQLNSLLLSFENLKNSAKGYVEITSKGILIQNTQGQIHDLQDLEAALKQYVGDVKNLEIQQRIMAGQNVLVATYRDADGQVKSLRASIDATSKSMRILNVESKKGIGFVSAYTGSLGDIFKSFLNRYSGYMLIIKLNSAFKQGFDVLKKYNDALTNISYTMNLGKENLDALGKSAVQMSKDLSLSLENTLSIYKIYANMQTSAKEIQETGKATAILANLSGADASKAADQVQGVIQQFNLLKNSESDVADVSMHVVDVLDKISGNVAIDYAKGINVITDAVTATGQVAHDAGMTYEELAAISAKIAERTREDGGTIGNALKTMFTRISKVSKMPQYSDEIDEDAIGKAGQALKDIGIEIVGVDGNFRNMTDILTELNNVWGTLNDEQQSYIAFQIAATRQSAKFKSMLEAWTDGMSLAEEATSASGNALKNQEKYIDSYSGKLQAIKNETQIFWLNLLDSDLLKNAMDLLKGFLETINKLPPSLVALTTVGLIPLINIIKTANISKNFGRPQRVSNNVLMMPNDIRVLTVSREFRYVAA